MPTDDYNYFANENEDYGQQEPPNQLSQEPSQLDNATQPDISQLRGYIEHLKDEISTLKANPLASLGYQPINQNSNRFNSEDPNVQQAKAFLENQGVLTENALVERLANEAREEFALNNGYQNTQHLASDFWGTYYTLQSPQQKAELESLMNLYESGSRANIAKAIKGFTEFKQKANNQVNQNQSFGHVPQNNLQSQQKQAPHFRSANEFNAWMRTQDPARRTQIYADWKEGNIPDPF